MVDTIIEKIDLLISGKFSQLGRELNKQLIGAEILPVFLGRSELDLSKKSEIDSVLRKYEFKTMINCAAWTDVDKAEANSPMVRKINTEAPGLLAKNCKDMGAKFVQISTDYVFSGTSQVPYLESDPVDPISEYGKSKAEGEKNAEVYGKSATTIIRTSWLYSKWNKNFVKSIIGKLLTSNKDLSVVDDQTGQPTFAGDLAKQILQFESIGLQPGIFHFTNRDSCSRFEFAVEIARLVNIGEARIKATKSEFFGSKNLRPNYSVLDSSRLDNLGLEEIPDWKTSLSKNISEIYKQVELELQSNENN
jgi:dTDP-4-dehydrorhamnose reductase